MRNIVPGGSTTTKDPGRPGVSSYFVHHQMRLSVAFALPFYKGIFKNRQMPQTKPIVSIENVVASASVDQKIDLNEVTKKFPDTEYHPDQFPGLVFRLKTPRTATLIFRTGKMVCTGAKSEEMAVKAVQTVVERLRKGGIKIKNDAEIVVQNIVAAINLGGRIHLEHAARTLPRSMYEPEQFPGLIHRMLDPKTVILLFASGKLVCTGAKKESDVYRSVNNLHSLLEEKKLMIYDE